MKENPSTIPVAYFAKRATVILGKEKAQAISGLRSLDYVSQEKSRLKEILGVEKNSDNK